MIRTIFAMLLGRAIDRRDGRGGMKGAIIGAMGQRALTRMGPFGWVIGGLILLWSLLTGRKRRY
ncbi:MULTISPECIES: hypothetical protein [unclassified Sphingomonas]|uniref:hypothetical protein n=1 Tax=unclassified Sphingomonas TaxID=196159 RepID=UPI002151733A|nr:MULTISPECIES: hypothetical protein [unclassified Sphingomonas]MCR5871356.1 hypothetical protein [Sphingomonas sp. J344]UUY00341.1 hypothetical protein LRS08_04315 [Sphingomonas sp. J315]